VSTNSETAPAPVGTEAASSTRSLPAFCRTCQLRGQPCGYEWQECAAAEEADRQMDEEPPGQMRALAWALDRVFAPLEGEA